MNTGVEFVEIHSRRFHIVNNMANDNSMHVAVKAASYNMFFQIIFRVGTFFMNAVLLRYISREVLGLVNVRLMLLYNTILFISREAFRKACLTTTSMEKQDSEGKQENTMKKLVNLIWLCVAIGVLTFSVLCFLWISVLKQPSLDILYDYKLCCFLIGLSSVIELFVEPLWIMGQRNNYVTTKVVLDGILVFVRCIVSTILVIFFPRFGLFCFACGFLVSALVYFVSYYGYFWWCINQNKEGFPFKTLTEIFPDWNSPFSYPAVYYQLVISFYKQSLLKQFLTEGERYVMTVFNILTFGEQGIYDVINNLGSLAARFIFMPIEESYYTYFSQILVRGKTGKDHDKKILKSASDSLAIVLKFVSLAGFIIFTFGYGYSFLLLDLYGGQLLSQSEGPILLKMYCVYVLVIAINGITECFMFAGMSKERVDLYNYKMFAFSVIFLLASLVFTKYFSAVGFIMANCLNMSLRITQSILFINEFFMNTPHRPLSSILPTAGVIVSLICSFVVIYLSEQFFCYGRNRLYQAFHVIIGGICFMAVLTTVYFTEHNLVSFGKEFVKKRSTKKKE